MRHADALNNTPFEAERQCGRQAQDGTKEASIQYHPTLHKRKAYRQQYTRMPRLGETTEVELPSEVLVLSPRESHPCEPTPNIEEGALQH